MAGSTTQGSDSASAHGKNVTISVSAIIASIWAGLWGFNWAASHLQSGQLFLAIIVGLGVGTGLTAYLIYKAFEVTLALIQLPGDNDITVKAMVAAPPSPGRP